MKNQPIKREEAKFNSIETEFDYFSFKTETIEKVKLSTSQPWNHNSCLTRGQNTGNICEKQLLKLF